MILLTDALKVRPQGKEVTIPQSARVKA